MTLPPEVLSLAKRSHPVIAWGIAAFAVALGFGVQTPNAKFQQLQAQIIANRDSTKLQLDTLKRDRWEMLHMMQFSVRYICTNLSPADQYKLGGVDVCAAAAHNGGSP